MVKYLNFLALIFLVISVVEGNIKEAVDDNELLGVTVLFRHGARSIYVSYPTDPYKSEKKYWPMGYGQLTELGQNMQTDLGKWFRKRYDNFLPKRYNPTVFYVRSTDVNRTIFSAYYNLKGLFPKDYEKIPINKEPAEKDHVLLMSEKCDTYDKAFKEDVSDSSEYKKWIKESEPLFKELEEYTKKKMGFNETSELYDTLWTEDFNDLKLPEWTKNYYPSKIKPYRMFFFKQATLTKRLAHLLVGPFLALMLENFDTILSGAPLSDEHPLWGHKFLMLSAHDTILYNVLSALAVRPQEIPFYADTIIFELRKSKEKTYVNLLYKSEDTLSKIRLPGCKYEFNCKYDVWHKALEEISYTHDEWLNVCKNDC